MAIVRWNDFCPTIFGPGALNQLSDEVRKLGMTKIMVCTEADLIKFNVATKAIDVLKSSGVDVVIYDKCKGYAPSNSCDEGAAFARSEHVDGIVAVGGGSSIDTAKAICLIIGEDATTVRDLYTVMEPHSRKIPLIAVPTTAGTGSENSKFAVICDSLTGEKRVPRYTPDLAICDPEMTYSLPASQTAATGMDALAHCVEAITSKLDNPYANIIALEGIRIVLKWLPLAVKEPQNKAARENMLFAANLGGMAILYCSCQMGHAWSQCFSSKHSVPHGLGCAWGLPGVMMYSAKHCPKEKLLMIADAMGIADASAFDSEELAKLMSTQIVDLMREIGIPSIKGNGFSLEECLDVANLFENDAAFRNTPGNPNVENVKEYIKYIYEIYQ